jgi:hypothetical protein
LSRLIFEERFSLLRAVSALRMRKGLLTTGHYVCPVLSVRGQIGVPSEWLNSLSLASLVDQCKSKGSIIRLSKAQADEGNQPLDNEEEMHFFSGRFLVRDELEMNRNRQTIVAPVSKETARRTEKCSTAEKLGALTELRRSL